MNDVKKVGPFHMAETSVGTYAIQFGSGDTLPSWAFSPQSWDGEPTTVAGVKIVPWGIDNNMPVFVRNLLEENNLAPGILERKTGLIYGQGPMLYTVAVEHNERLQKWLVDPEIQSWLDSWDYKRYIRDCLVEFNNMKGIFVKYYSGKAIRIGKPWISKLECVPSTDSRLVWPDNDSRRLDDVKRIMIGDFVGYNSEFRLYPVFDKWNPTRSEVAMKYHSMSSFGRNMYSLSSFFGSVPWMQDANSLPQIISYLNNNMIAAAYIVHEPIAYWNQKEEVLRSIHPEFSDAAINAEIAKLQEDISRQIADVMAGKRNAGKFFTCIDLTDENGNVCSWKIEPIEMNIDKYIEALSKISRIADSSTTSGLGLNPALANIIIDGKGDSGSQMLYALKLFYGADTQIPEDICLEAINDAIRINFPNKKGIFLGMYRKVINKEDNVSASDRATNQV